MTHSLHFLALDTGAESGRVMHGVFDGTKILLEESHRFTNAPVRLATGLHTDVLHIFDEMKKGLAIAIKNAGNAPINSIGVDTWGVDFALLDSSGALLGNPYHYRDNLTDGILEKAFVCVPKAEIFEETGIQFMALNTLYQLYALRLKNAPILDHAETLLFMPDLFNYWLSGKKVSEFSIATTSQCFNPRKNDWAKSLIGKFGIPTKIFSPIVSPGTILGDLLPSVAEDIGAKNRIQVIAPGCHDTTLAVAAVPAQSENFAYISCGTWSLIGAEINKPCISQKSLDADFTNEGGVANTFRFLKNTTGLWVLQECRREWLRRGEDLSYDQMTKLAMDAPSLKSFIDTSYSEFAKPGNMVSRVCEYCAKTGQPVPDSNGAIIRCIIESLAFTYRETLDNLDHVLDMRHDPLHMVGGGIKNKLLCQFTANVTGRTVFAGPVEATAIGNIMMQAMSLGHIGSLKEGRDIIRNSFDICTYKPQNTDEWNAAYDRFLALKKSNSRSIS